ncbi:MAG TPA: RNA-binding protein [Terracidiphilus sp.]|nr:putative RNA-binding protein RbpA [Candidatus Sulfopaludibacter sp. SbA4]HXR39797.1 RNA-binding protein [Terracidiphilus sp.]
MNNIRIGNLDPEVTEHNIRSIFAQHGAIERFKIMTDRATGQPRGFGFIQMANDADAEKAIVALNGTECNGKALKVHPARPQLHRGSRPKRD